MELTCGSICPYYFLGSQFCFGFSMHLVHSENKKMNLFILKIYFAHLLKKIFYVNLHSSLAFQCQSLQYRIKGGRIFQFQKCEHSFNIKSQCYITMLAVMNSTVHYCIHQVFPFTQATCQPMLCFFVKCFHSLITVLSS